MSNSQKIAVVTGGAQGIGSAVCTLLVSQGWRVHALDLNGNLDGDIINHRCDVTSEVDVSAIAQEIGPVDALIPCAGIHLRPRDNSARKMELEAWNMTLAVNLTGTMLAVKAFDPLLRPDGAIVTVSSVAALRAMPGADAYTASKGAIVALTRSWSVEFGRRGIRVNCVCPGPTDTAMMEGILDELDGAKSLGLPQQRMAATREVADLIAFLVSDASTYLSGAIIPLDGGATAHSAGMPFPRRTI